MSEFEAMNYTRPEYIDYEGKGFESCLFFAIPESFKKLGINEMMF